MSDTENENMESENLAYLENGEEVEVLQRTEHGIIVCRLYDRDPDEEPYVGDPEIIEAVFDAPPVERRDKHILELEERERELNAAIQEKRRELDSMEPNAKRMEALAAKDAAFGRICDFIEGKMTHYVVSRYGIHEILEAESGGSIPHTDDYGRTEGTKLLTLFGKSGNSLAWRLSQYTDGSGSGFECEPFCSLDDAKARLQEIVNGYGSLSAYHQSRLIEVAEKHGLCIPPGLVQNVAHAEITGAESGVAKVRKELAEAEAKMRETVDKWGLAMKEQP